MQLVPLLQGLWMQKKSHHEVQEGLRFEHIWCGTILVWLLGSFEVRLMCYSAIMKVKTFIVC